MATGEDKNEIMDKLKELEASLAKELDQKVRLAEPTDPRLEGGIDVNPDMAEAVKKAKEAGQSHASSQSDQKVMDAAAAQNSGIPSAQVSMAAGAAKRAATAASQAAADGAKVVSGAVPPTSVQVVGGGASGTTQGTGTGPSVAGQTSTNQGNTRNSSIEKQVDDITLTDVDDLLNQMDAGFQASMNEIKNELNQIKDPPNLESINIGPDYLDEAEGIEKEEDIADSDDLPMDLPEALPTEREPGESLADLLRAVALATIRLPMALIRALAKQIPHIKTAPRDAIFSFMDSVSDELRQWVRLIIAVIKKLLSYPAKVYLTLALFIVIFAVMSFLFHDAYRNFFTADQEKDPFLRNFNDVADSMQVIPEEENGEDLESPLKHPEYTVLVHRMIANLHAPNSFSSPMVTLELYIEASNQECAVEIHNRESEIKDIIQRTLEETDFDELETVQGKVRLKVRIRRGLNRILNKGTAKRIMFKTLNTKK